MHSVEPGAEQGLLPATYRSKSLSEPEGYDFHKKIHTGS